MKLDVLLGCEESQIITEAFIKLGHNAMSCDLNYPGAKGLPHYQGNILDILFDRKWNLLIAHPPCTYISHAANGYWDTPGRARKRLEALDFFLKLWEAPIDHICLENPLGCADRIITKHSQIIHPYHFGEPHLKKTCLWLKNLPKLVHVGQDDLFLNKTHTEKPEPIYVDKSGKKRYFTEAISGKSKRGGGHLRSKTFNGIGQAMAEQWSEYIINKISNEGN